MDTLIWLLPAILFILMIGFLIKQANRKHVPPKFPLLEEELIAFESDAIWLKSTFGVKTGRLYLTNLRLIYAQNNNSFGHLFGIIGLLIAQFLSPKKPTIDVYLKNIKSVQRTKYGFNKNVLNLTDNKGMVYRLSFAKKLVEPWLSEFSKYSEILPQTF